MPKAKTPVKHELPENLLAAGWRLEYDSLGWCKAIHDEKQIVTGNHYPTPHRGLKFVLRDIERLENNS